MSFCIIIILRYVTFFSFLSVIALPFPPFIKLLAMKRTPKTTCNDFKEILSLVSLASEELFLSSRFVPSSSQCYFRWRIFPHYISSLMFAKILKIVGTQVVSSIYRILLLLSPRFPRCILSSSWSASSWRVPGAALLLFLNPCARECKANSLPTHNQSHTQRKRCTLLHNSPDRHRLLN